MDRAQKKLGNSEVQSRKNTLAFDTILSDQRNRIYEARNKVMAENEAYFEQIIEKALHHVIHTFIYQSDDLSVHTLSDFIFNHLKSDYPLKEIEAHIDSTSSKSVMYDYLFGLAQTLITQSLHRFKDPVQLRYFKKVIILKAIDQAWVNQLDYLQQLKNMVNGRGMAQHKPLNEFGREARRRFFEMEDEIYLGVFRSLALSELKMNEDGTIELEFP